MSVNFVGSGPMLLDAEGVASAAVAPGTAVNITNSSGSPRYTAAGANARGLFAIVIPDAENGKGPDDSYAAGDKVKVCYPQKGQLFLGFVNQNAAKNPGTLLSTAASGQFAEAAANGNVQAVLVEAHAASTTATLRWMRAV